MIYTPAHFSENGRSRLFRFMRQHSFATLISGAGDEPSVAHLPVLVDEARNLVRAHVARANPLWRDFTPDRKVLLIFHGPHRYISPSWYSTHPSVPTWNYAVVHVTGSARVIEEQTDQDRTRIMSMLRDLVGENEAQFSRPWRMELPADYMRKMIDGIVAFEIDIARITGKFKLSQNRPAADRLNVIAALEQSGADEARAVARLMKEIFQAPDE
jgi:transcriptional regulator